MRRLLLLPLLAVAVMGLGACGSDEVHTITEAESEAFYVTLDELQYQVQLSRQLDPFAQSDRDLLAGVPKAQRGLADDEVWFGVWLRALNGTEQPRSLADNFIIKDTTGGEFEPVQMTADSPFAYRPGPIAAGAGYPVPNSASGQSPTTGAFLLFRMPVRTLDFRPLELELASSKVPDAAAKVRLDV
jgi:hypothetical protein